MFGFLSTPFDPGASDPSAQRPTDLGRRFAAVLRCTVVAARLALATLLGLLALAALAGCGDEPEADEPVRPVRVAEALPADGATMRAFSGRTQAPVDARLSFRVGGPIVRLPVEVGEALRAGQLVAEVDPSDYRVRVREAEAALAQAEAQARQAAAEYDRVRALFADDHVSRSAFDRARSQQETTTALVEAARERLRLARQQLSYTRLTTPTGGTVADRTADLGETVQPGQPVVTLAGGGPLEVEIRVPEDLIGRVRAGASVDVALAALGDTLAGTVQEVGSAPRRGGTAFPVIVRLDDAPEAVRPGMAAQVAFAFQRETPSASDAVVVPPEAVASDPDGAHVFVVEGASAGDTTAVRRHAVTPGALTAQGLEVTGLRPGARVVTAGVETLTDGRRIRLPAGSASGSAARPVARR